MCVLRFQDQEPPIGVVCLSDVPHASHCQIYLTRAAEPHTNLPLGYAVGGRRPDVFHRARKHNIIVAKMNAMSKQSADSRTWAQSADSEKAYACGGFRIRTT